MNDLTLKGYMTYLTAKDALEGRMAQDEGQTAAEYLGIVVVIAIIIGAIYNSSIDSSIAEKLNELVDSIFGGGREG